MGCNSTSKRSDGLRRSSLLFALLALSGSHLSLYGQGTPNPVPFVNQPVEPASVAPGGAGFTLTVNGTGFVSGSVVNWNGSARTTTFVSSLQLTAMIAASDIATAGTASITVTSPSPGGGTSNVQFLSVTNPAPTVKLAGSIPPQV